jgi:hypothetical protein
VAAGALCATLAAGAARAAPRAVVILEPGAWGDELGRVTEALQVYLRDFGATVRVAADPDAEVRAIAARGEADFAVVLQVHETQVHLQIGVTDLRGAQPRASTSEVDVPSGVQDPARHVALLVRAELAAAARAAPAPPPPAPAVVAAPAPPPAPDHVLAAAAGAFGTTTLAGHVEVGLSALLGQSIGQRFVGGLAEVGREQARTSALGHGDITRVAVGIDVRPGRLADRPHWALLWGGQAGVSWTRTYLIGDETRVFLADTYAPFVRAGLWSWHRIGPRVALTWDAGIELLPLATRVKAGPDTVLSSGYLRPRLALSVLVDL